MITCDFAILPVGTETTECKDYVTAAVQAIKDSGLNYQLTGMGTQIEAENLTELYRRILSNYQFIIHIAHNELLEHIHDMTIMVYKENNVSKIMIK